jgi:hypothetical protein
MVSFASAVKPNRVFLEIAKMFPNPPPCDKMTLHGYTLSIGVIIGRLIATGFITAAEGVEACHMVSAKNSPQEIKKMIWNQ